MREIKGKGSNWFFEISTIHDGIATFWTRASKEGGEGKYDSVESKGGTICIAFGYRACALSLQDAMEFRAWLDRAISEVQEREAAAIITTITDAK